MDARNMYRREVNKYIKQNCAPSWTYLQDYIYLYWCQSQHLPSGRVPSLITYLSVSVWPECWEQSVYLRCVKQRTHMSSLLILFKLWRYLLTYLLTPWIIVLLEELTGFQLVKKFPAFIVTLRFITAVTSVRQLRLSWASSIQSISPHPTFWCSILILSYHLRLGLPSGLFPSGFHTKTLYRLCCDVTEIERRFLIINRNNFVCYRIQICD